MPPQLYTDCQGNKALYIYLYDCSEVLYFFCFLLSKADKCNVWLRKAETKVSRGRCALKALWQAIMRC